MELRKRALALALGLVSGFAMLLGTWWLLFFGKKGEIFSKVSQFYIGYSFTWGGAIIGFVWGFVYGFVAGFLIAWIYNLVVKAINKPKTA